MKAYIIRVEQIEIPSLDYRLMKMPPLQAVPIEPESVPLVLDKPEEFAAHEYGMGTPQSTILAYLPDELPVSFERFLDGLAFERVNKLCKEVCDDLAFRIHAIQSTSRMYDSGEFEVVLDGHQYRALQAILGHISQFVEVNQARIKTRELWAATVGKLRPDSGDKGKP